MRRHAIITRLGRHDRGAVRVTRDIQVRTVLPFLAGNLPADSRIGHERLFGEMSRLGLRPPELAMDLLVLSITAFAADLRINRSVDSQDGWTREIDLYVPVSDVGLWEQQRPLLVGALGFLTGDRWRFFFRPRPSRMETIAPEAKKNAQLPYQTNMVCLFSGGLDSFIGAIDLIESGPRPLLLGHHKSADVANVQSRCLSQLTKWYKERAPEFIDAYVRVPKRLFGGADDKTERGRSFLFLSLGAAFASALGEASHLVIPENGFISLNIPLTPLRLGALSTRTTHPHFISQFQTLLETLGLGVRLSNPYQFKTKGEMVQECKNPDVLREGIRKSMSCAHPTARRYSGQPPRHCGTCVPCIIRQAALRTAYNADPTRYNINIFSRVLDATKSEGEQIRAFNMAIAHARSNPHSEYLMIHGSGPLPGRPDTIDELSDVYRRGMAEIASLLTNVSTS